MTEYFGRDAAGRPQEGFGGRAFNYFSSLDLRVAALGGGTGLPVLLRGLKAALFPSGRKWMPERDRERVTAIVTVADDGGSSGRLRRSYQVTPPGDIRNCLLALADGDPATAAIFNFRFNGNSDLTDHSLGNLILTALSELETDFVRAVDRCGEILRSRGRVLPATLEDVTLAAEYDNGSVIEGESRIASARLPIRRVFLRPETSRALPAVEEAISEADLVVIGPGSLYTSLIPVLLVRGVVDAIARSKARVVLVMNLMTEPGETDDYSAARHVEEIRGHVPQIPIHYVLLNSARIPGEPAESYRRQGALPVSFEMDSLRVLGCRPVARDLFGSGPKIRHDSTKLARAILELATEMPA
jgi:uncharacterized cofD-like protein